MTFNKFLIVFTAFTLILTACSSETPTPNANTVTNTNTVAPTNTNSNAAAPNSNSAVETIKPTQPPTTNNADTIKPVVLAYYEALKTKNEEALKKVYSKQTLALLEADAKAEGKKSLVEFITELEPVPTQPFEVRNEQINGDVAIAEMRGGAYPNGIKIKFIKEDGAWKMTNESPEFQKK